jgi:hypothetical protein
VADRRRQIVIFCNSKLPNLCMIWWHFCCAWVGDRLFIVVRKYFLFYCLCEFVMSAYYLWLVLVFSCMSRFILLNVSGAHLCLCCV